MRRQLQAPGRCRWGGNYLNLTVLLAQKLTQIRRAESTTLLVTRSALFVKRLLLTLVSLLVSPSVLVSSTLTLDGSVLSEPRFACQTRTSNLVPTRTMFRKPLPVWPLLLELRPATWQCLKSPSLSMVSGVHTAMCSFQTTGWQKVVNQQLVSC